MGNLITKKENGKVIHS